MVQRSYKPQRIAGDVVAQALALLRRDVPQTEIAEQLGIGRNTVRRIARGEIVAGAQSARCPGCGGLLLRPAAPCLACTLRRPIDAAG